MSLQHRRIKKQPRDNRFSINLTNDETSLLTAASNLSGIEIKRADSPNGNEASDPHFSR
jgi:hypothetical protein